MPYPRDGFPSHGNRIFVAAIDGDRRDRWNNVAFFIHLLMTISWMPGVPAMTASPSSASYVLTVTAQNKLSVLLSRRDAKNRGEKSSTDLIAEPVGYISQITREESPETPDNDATGMGKSATLGSQDTYDSDDDATSDSSNSDIQFVEYPPEHEIEVICLGSSSDESYSWKSWSDIRYVYFILFITRRCHCCTPWLRNAT